MDYYFTTSVTSGDYTQGASHQRGLMLQYQNNGWYDNRYEMTEWNLWGNPDLGMAPVLSSDGAVILDKTVYGAGQQAEATVRDLDLNMDPETIESFAVLISTSGGDQEDMTLTETALDSSIFSGDITLQESVAVPGNGLLDVGHGDSITVLYIDADDGQGGVNIENTASAQADCVAPVISGVQVSHCSDVEMTISWDTNEESDSRLYYGITTPDQSVVSHEAALHHEITISDLEFCTDYLFYVASMDPAGNLVTDDNSGQNYTGTTYDRFLILQADMSSDPGWLSSGGDWGYGQPTGGGGQHGAPDPTSGHTGDAVIGYNLDGDYPNNMQKYTIQTQAIDCSSSANVHLSFWRWLGVETSIYDHASIELSTNGSDWETIWENPGRETADDAWKYVEYDVTAQAAYQSNVYIQWVLGPTDQGWRYCGWNIDDVMVRSIWPCGEPTPTPPPTATPTEIPTPTPPQDSGIELQLDDEEMTEGDRFYLHFDVRNANSEDLTVDIYILLDVFGEYWCWPSWQSIQMGLDGRMDVILPAHFSESETVLDFIWPDITGAANGLMFYGVCCHASTFEVIGNLQVINWSYY
jgi:hypothetical protein